MEYRIPTAGVAANITEPELATQVAEVVKAADSYLQPYHEQWFQNIAYRRGCQWVKETGNMPAGQSSDDDDLDRVRAQVNLILGYHQTRVAKILKLAQGLEVSPENSTERAKRRARKGSDLFQFVWVEERMPKKLKTMAEWLVDTGTAYLWGYWDNGIGDQVHAPDGSVVNLGGLKVRLLTAFDVVPYGVMPDGSVRGYIVCEAQPVEDLAVQFPGREFVAEKDITSRARYQQKVMSLGLYDSDNKITSLDNCAIRYTMVENPSPKYPEGRYIIVCGQHVLYAGPLPDGLPKVPIVKFVDIAVSGQPFGIAGIENLITLQKLYNKSWSQLVENIEGHANIKLMAPDGAKLEVEAFDDSGKEVVYFKKGLEPHQLQPTALPSHFINAMNDLYPKAFQDVSGIHEVTQAKAPAGVKSGVAIEALLMEDDSRFAPTRLDFNESLEEFGEIMMLIFESQILEPRKFDIAKTTRSLEVRPDDLKGMHRNVKVKSTSTLNWDVRFNRDQIMQFWQEGLLGEPKDPKVRKKVIEMLEIGNVDAVFEEVDLDADWAAEENYILAYEPHKLQPMPVDPAMPQGEQVLSLPAQKWEDVDIHVRQHNQFRKTEEFRNLSPDVKAAFDAHVKAHLAIDNPPPVPPPGAQPGSAGPTPQQGGPLPPEAAPMMAPGGAGTIPAPMGLGE
ncbi:MAG TPA: hypothetical protein PLL10_00190 [Elusimicrobiales bacterium]|nr:hypothetical protein [Elusimicrobiales bacterium]